MATTEIRWHGRAGQGVVTASELLAEMALHEGRYFQSFPEFGAERRGAPVRAFTRISDDPLRDHSQVEAPDVVVVLDNTLLGVVDVCGGLKADGILIANTSASPQQLRKRLAITNGIRVFTVDASRIAMETMRRNITNTPMIAALLKAVPLVSHDAGREQVKERLGSRLAPQVVQANVEAFDRGRDEVQEG